MSRRGRGYRDFEQTMSLSGGIIDILLVLALIAAFVVVTLVVFVCWTFAKYHKHKALWIALSACIALAVAGVVLFKLLSIGGFLLLVPVGITVLLVACVVVQLRSSSTLMRENVSLIDSVLHSNWFHLEDSPRQDVEDEQLAA